MGVQELTEYQSAYLAGLRDLVARLEEQPDLISEDGETATVTVNIFASTREQAVEFSRRLGGQREKYPLGDFYYVFKRSFGPHSIEVNVARDQVCKRVVVGQREVPAKEATTEDIVEWVCDDAVLS